MGWLFKERRGGRPEWKQAGWTDETISSSFAILPPFPLLAIFGIVMLFLSITHYSDYKAQMEKTMFNFHILLFLLPVLLIFLVRSISSSSSSSGNNGRFIFRMPRIIAIAGERNSNPTTNGGGGGGGGGPPWGVAALLVVLIVMISYKSSFDSKWFRPLWGRSD